MRNNPPKVRKLLRVKVHKSIDTCQRPSSRRMDGLIKLAAEDVKISG